MRHKKAEKRVIEADKIYNNLLVAKFINRLMKDGKKTIAEKVVYGAFDLLTQKGQDPLAVFLKALDTVGPKVEIKARRIGGANYQVPVEVKGDRRMAVAIRWVLEAAQNRKDAHSMSEKLVLELTAAAEGQGEAMKKKDNMTRQADANKAFASFRW
jgi:small subunit ribosomal protein S7